MYDLWRGVDGKIREAERSYREMGISISPPDHTWENAALVAAGVDVNRPWQDTFYPHVSTFLAKVRSVPSIIRACFGKDLGSAEMRDWWDRLTPDERLRREDFSDQFRVSAAGAQHQQRPGEDVGSDAPAEAHRSAAVGSVDHLRKAAVSGVPGVSSARVRHPRSSSGDLRRSAQGSTRDCASGELRPLPSRI